MIMKNRYYHALRFTWFIIIKKVVMNDKWTHRWWAQFSCKRAMTSQITHISTLCFKLSIKSHLWWNPQTDGFPSRSPVLRKLHSCHEVITFCKVGILCFTYGNWNVYDYCTFSKALYSPFIYRILIFMFALTLETSFGVCIHPQYI